MEFLKSQLQPGEEIKYRARIHLISLILDIDRKERLIDFREIAGTI